MNPAELLPFVLIGGVFWLLVMRPAKKRRDDHNRMMATLAPGAQIMTTAGLFGTVVGLDAERVGVELAPGVIVQMVPQAIAKILPQEPADELDQLLEAAVADDSGLTPPPSELAAEAAPTRPSARDADPDQGAARA